MQSPSSVRSAFIAILSAAVLVGAGYAYWHHNRPTDPPPPPRDLILVRDGLVTKSSELVKDIGSLGNAPWLAGSKLEDAFAQRKRRITDRLGYLLGMDSASLRDPDAHAANDKTLTTLEAQLTEDDAQIKSFLSDYVVDDAILREAFTHLTATADGLRVIEEASVTTTEIRARLAAINSKYEEGRRFWIDSMSARLISAEPYDDTIRKIGIATVAKCKNDVMPIYDQVKPAREELLRLSNHEKGVEARMMWVERLLSELDSKHAVKSREEGTIDHWKREWQPYMARLQAMRAAALEQSHDHQRAVLELEREMNAFLERMNVLFLPIATEVGFPLPK